VDTPPGDPTTPTMSQRRVVVTGLGLMGGSAAAALTAAGATVQLHHRRREVAAKAESLGYGIAHDDLATAALDCELAVIGVPIPHVPAIARELLAANPHLVVTDMGSTKATVCRELAEEGRAGRFVGSHPMCGSHLQGLANARADLFADATVALTPCDETPPEALAAVRSLWESVGGRCERLDPADHDRAVASASHLPHVLAATSAALLDDDGLRLAATGFRDVSRVAAGSPGLWRDILRENRHAVGERIAEARELLEGLERALGEDDAAAIEERLERGRAGRQRYEDRR